MQTFFIILLLIWLGGYLLFKYILPWLLLHFVKKMTNNQNYKKTDNNTKTEGTITVDYIPEKENLKKKKNIDKGEYIDFEEIKS